MKTIRSLHITVPADLQRLADLDEPVIAFFNADENEPVAEATVYDVRLVLQELCVNIVTHAYENNGGEIELGVALAGPPTTIVITSVDRGKKAFDIDSWSPPRLDEPQVHGYGIFLIQHLMDNVEYQRQGSANHWRMTKQIVPN